MDGPSSKQCQWCGGSGWQPVPFVGGYPEPCAVCNPKGEPMKPGGPRAKGAVFERDCVNAAKGYNIPTERSGHAQTTHSGNGFFGDISMKVMGLYRKIECKIAGDTPKIMYKWIKDGDNYAVFHRRDREPTLVTMRYTDWLSLVHAAAYGKPLSDLNLAVDRDEEVDAE